MTTKQEPFGWYVNCPEHHFFMKNNRANCGAPSDDWLDKYEDELIPLYTHPKNIDQPK